MAKFHINKNGVPAPCKAKEGNCPLGGDETHFYNMEDAQAHADKVNEGKHGILPAVSEEEEVSLELSEDSKSYLFGKSYNNHGYVDVGIHTVNMWDSEMAGMGDDEKDPLIELRTELERKMPEVVSQEKATIIPDYNAEAYFKNHVITKNAEEYKGSDNYERLAETVKKFNPSAVSTSFGGDVEIEYDEVEKISKFAAKKSLEESNLKINGDKFFVGTYDDRNWAEEYYKNNNVEEFDRRKRL